jgi:hypothetical protein
MTKRGWLFGWVLVGVAGVLSTEGCGATSSRQYKKPSKAAGTSGMDQGTTTVEPQGGQGGDGTLALYDERCGIARTNACIPDLTTNDVCKPSIGGATQQSPAGGRGGGQSGDTALAHAGESAAGASTNGGAPNDAGQGGAGGQGGETSTLAGAGGAANDTASAGEGGASVNAGTGGGFGAQSGRGGTGPVGGTGGGTAGGPVSTLSPTSCQVVENPKHEGEPLATCVAAGTRGESESCFTGSDCAPGLACVGSGPGQCRRYCCSGESACGSKRHCSIEALVPFDSGTSLSVPVCMPVVDCSLAEPYQCPEGARCSCPRDSACVIVSPDGTTSCVPTASLPPEGQGIEGSACPCAWGFVCSQATKECVKLCQTAAPTIYCGEARCQPSSTLPVGWGTCVGVAPKGTSN